MTADTHTKGLGTQTLVRHALMDKDGGAAWLKARRAALARKKANYLRNKAARANLYASSPREMRAGEIPLYHSTLRALSAGTYG